MSGRASQLNKLQIDTKRSSLLVPEAEDIKEIRSATIGRKKTVTLSPSPVPSRKPRLSFSNKGALNGGGGSTKNLIDMNAQENENDDRKIPESAKIINQFFKSHHAGVVGCVQGLIFIYKKLTVSNESLKSRYEEMSSLVLIILNKIEKKTY